MFQVTEILRFKKGKEERRVPSYYNHKNVLCVMPNPDTGEGARLYVCKKDFYTIVDCVESVDLVMERIDIAKQLETIRIGSSLEKFRRFLEKSVFNTVNKEVCVNYDSDEE